jgi:hypothetical protein
MKNIITYLSFFGIFFFCFSFEIHSQTNQQVFANVNRSGAGTGDLKGVFVNLGYQKYFKKKLSWYAEFGANSHNGEDYLSYTINNNPPVDASIRFVTSGMQLGGGFGYSPLRTAHEIQFKLGTILRYQASNAASGYAIYFPPMVNLPFPVITLDNGEKMRTYSIGYKLNISYSYTIKKKYIIGVNGFYQNDTNADTFFGYGLAAGISF